MNTNSCNACGSPSQIQDLAWSDPISAYAISIGLQPLPTSLVVTAVFADATLFANVQNAPTIISFSDPVHQRTFIDRVDFDLLTPNQNAQGAINLPSPPNANPAVAPNNILNNPAPFTMANGQEFPAAVVPGQPISGGAVYPPQDAQGNAGLIQGFLNNGGPVGATTAAGAEDFLNQAGSPFSTLAQTMLKSQPGVSVRVAVEGNPRYVVSNQFTPLENFAALALCKQFQGWPLYKTQKIQIDFVLTQLPFTITSSTPYIINVTFNGWQFLDPIANRMSRKEARAHLRRMGFQTIRDEDDTYPMPC